MLVLAVVALGVPLASTLSARVDAEVRSEARGQADVVAASAADLVTPPQTRELQRLASTAARSVRGRVVITNESGVLLADSAGTPPGRDYGTRPEIRAALSGRADQRRRMSDTLNQSLLATAVPILKATGTVGAVRITQSTSAVDRAVKRAWLELALVGALVVTFGLGAGWLLARQVAQPLLRLEEAASRVAEGDLTARAKVEGSSEQQLLARTFNEMTERIGRLLSSQREFVADASHQLRTPLAGLRLRIEAARSEAEEPEAQADLDDALDEVDRMALMVGELLELSRVGERDLPGERIDLADAAARAADRWAHAAGDRDQHVRAPPPDGRALAFTAQVDLDRVLDALVENALNYSPPGSTVMVAARRDGIDVLDEGAGIEPGEEEAVFDRFHRGSAGRRGPVGTGLGLPIARELVRRWNGDVVLERRREGGTRARVTFPPA